MKYNTKQILKYYWKSSANFKLSGILSLVAVIGANIFDTIIPVFFKNFFNLLYSGQTKEVITAGLLSVLFTIGFLAFSRWFCYRISSFSINIFETSVMAEIGKKCFAYIHKHSFNYFSSNFTGSLVKRSKSFINAFENLCDQLFYELVPTTVGVIIIVTVLMKVNIFLGLGILVWILLILGINWFFTIYKLKYDIEMSEAETRTTGYLSDTITNNTNIKLFNGFKFEFKSFSDLTDKLKNIRKFSWDLAAKFEAVQSFLTVVLEVGIFYLAIQLWNKGLLTVGDFVLIQAYVLTVVLMAWHFGKVIRRIYEHMAEAEEMIIILNTPYEINDVKNATELKVKSGKIEFNEVGFSYNEKNKVIDNFSLEVKPEETVALVGTSGAGKTTLIKLLLRMHDIQEGKILIDGQDISKVTQESLRENVSLVPQDPVLFHRNLMENIRYGKLDATDEEVMVAAKIAHCDEFITNLPLGYETFVGERGIKLSGGERQRVAIARAILKNAPILILDEATSSLDSESEKFIQDSLDELMKNKTVIIVAHRLSTIKKADRIIVIDNKKIVEEGVHEKLIKKDGVYKRLWNIQVGGFIK